MHTKNVRMRPVPLWGRCTGSTDFTSRKKNTRKTNGATKQHSMRDQRQLWKSFSSSFASFEFTSEWYEYHVLQGGHIEAQAEQASAEGARGDPSDMHEVMESSEGRMHRHVHGNRQGDVSLRPQRAHPSTQEGAAGITERPFTYASERLEKGP